MRTCTSRSVKSYCPASSDVYLWIVPANAAGNGVVSAGTLPIECELALLDSNFSTAPRARGAAARIEPANSKATDLRDARAT